MHVLTLIRMYLGISQISLAKDAHITQADLSEMESMEPYGRIEKYRRVATALGLPIDPILKNSISGIPISFFEEHPHQTYIPEPKSGVLQIGRWGEDFIFEREQKRLQKSLPVHAYLVLPLYKMKAQRVGYDILSFDDNGMPVYLEVKTSCESEGQFVMTKNELDIAQRFTDEGKQYKIVVINNWGKEEMLIQDIPFGEFLTNHNITSKRYVCAPKRSCNTHMTGLAYFRRLRGLKEREIAEALDISQYKWSLYETGDREPPVKLLLRLSELLDATVDELLGKYSVDSI